MEGHGNCTIRFTGNRRQCEQIEAWLIAQYVHANPKAQRVGLNGKSEDLDTWKIDFRWSNILGMPSEHMAVFQQTEVRHVDVTWHMPQ